MQLFPCSNLQIIHVAVDPTCRRVSDVVSNYNDVMMAAITSQITSLKIVYSTVYSGADQRKASKLRVTGLCAGNSPGTSEFPAQMASDAENVSIWWRHNEAQEVTCISHVYADVNHVGHMIVKCSLIRIALLL